MPASLIACVKHCSQQGGSSREIATLDERLAFPVTPEDSPKSRVKSRCDILHGRHTPIGDGEIVAKKQPLPNAAPLRSRQCFKAIAWP